MSDSPATESPDIVARAGRYYRNARYILVVAVVCTGLWFAYDGWVRLPAEIARFNSLPVDKQAGEPKPHSQFAVDLQRTLAIGLFILPFPMLGWFLYRSRGAYRLSGTILQVPGHPSVPFEAMVDIDMRKWKRKGIAYVDYQLEESGIIRRLTLDDFIYNRQATDQIVARIEAFLNADNDDRRDNAPESEGSDPRRK